ncbi:endonuclease/exonuclease/phosphatase family protein [Niabella insulamsoli]|uniref:endonuclease/exonuclease/phosphatase family protein n=1 Tax=Niabella insulamsoli TaxID=3144874 RepID=UPI0031FD563D
MPTTRRKFIHYIGAAATAKLVLPQVLLASDAAKKSHCVLSCNIRVALPEDDAKGVGWAARKDICLKIIKKQQPDIVCFQEVLREQAADIRTFFPTYQLLGFDGPEMDAHKSGYHGIAKNPILFSKERYELLAAGVYWLSETPLVAGSKSWDTARARHANWVRLRDRKTHKELRVVSLHLDHVSGEAKLQQAKMVALESDQYPAAFPQIIAGDFNSRFDSPVLASLREKQWKESYETLHGEKEAGFTGHEFQGTHYTKAASKGRIDFIWYKGALQPLASRIIKDEINGRFPSDHFFIRSDFTI